MSNSILQENWKQFKTFPCLGNSKRPATRNGFKDAKTGQDVLAMVQAGYNPACALSLSGLIAIDLDYHNEDSTADEDLQALEKELEPLPKTLTQATATGKGKHLIFSARGIGQPIGKIGKNIDIKLNGFVMIAPSSINGRQYQIIDGIDENGKFIIADLPDKWVQYLNKSTNYRTNKAQNTFTYIKPKYCKNIDIDKMFRNCSFLQYCRDNADCLSEPEWFSMISVLAHIENSDELIHSLSEPYPTYSYEETQKKIDNARKFGIPQSCEYISTEFKEICKNCSAYSVNKEVHHDK